MKQKKQNKNIIPILIITMFILIIPQAHAEFDLTTWIKENILGTSMSYATSSECDSACTTFENGATGRSCSCTYNSNLNVYNIHKSYPSTTTTYTPNYPTTTNTQTTTSTTTCTESFKYNDGICHKSESFMSMDCQTNERLTINLCEQNGAVITPTYTTNTNTLTTTPTPSIITCTAYLDSLGLCSYTGTKNPSTTPTNTCIQSYKYGDNICHKSEPFTSIDCSKNTRLSTNLCENTITGAVVTPPYDNRSLFEKMFDKQQEDVQKNSKCTYLLEALGLCKVTTSSIEGQIMNYSIENPYKVCDFNKKAYNDSYNELDCFNDYIKSFFTWMNFIILIFIILSLISFFKGNYQLFIICLIILLALILAILLQNSDIAKGLNFIINPISSIKHFFS